MSKCRMVKEWSECVRAGRHVSLQPAPVYQLRLSARSADESLISAAVITESHGSSESSAVPRNQTHVSRDTTTSRGDARDDYSARSASDTQQH